MTRRNELIIDGVRTSSFPFSIIVKETPFFDVTESKTQLIEHDGINGAVIQSNKHRPISKREYTLQLIDPTEEDLYQFLALFSKEGFWLESEAIKSTRRWCYKVGELDVQQETPSVYVCKVVFYCHPTKFFKEVDTQTLTANGVLRLRGSALAFPKITVVGERAFETSFTIDDQVIKLETLSESLVMVNDPDNPSFKTVSGKLIKWSGDFITIDTSKSRTVGVVLGPGITSLKFETVWGWA
ncbi:TPA: phage tail protein [Streptococcus suis]